MPATIRLLCALLTALVLAGCGAKTATPTPAAPKAATPAVAPAPVVPELTETAAVESPDFGVLTVKIPGGGQIGPSKPVPGDPATTSVITFASGLVTQLRITTLGPVGLTPDFGKDASLKRELEKWAAALKGKTTEAELTPVVFDSEPVHGYYVAATDANPAPGQPKYLVNGFFRTSDGVFMLGGLSNDAPGAMAEFLAVAKTAHWESKPASSEAATPNGPQPSGK